MISGFVALLIVVVGLVWIMLTSLKATKVTIPAEFWLLYMIAVGLGTEVPKLVYSENNVAWLREYLYPFSNSFMAVPMAITGLQLLVNSQGFIEGFKQSVIGRWLTKQGRKDQRNDVEGVQFLGIGLLLFSGIILAARVLQLQVAEFALQFRR